MPFDPKPIARPQPHAIDPSTNRCIKCGAEAFDCYFKPGCQPDSEDARKFRREMRDEAVGRVIQRS